MKIPITMCHGVTWQPKPQKERPYLNLLTAKRFETTFRIASELGFQLISYDDLAGWCDGDSGLPDRPIMAQFGYQGNLFINTSPMEKLDNPYHMKWDEVQRLVDQGWHMGAHTHNHYRIDYLTKKDPSGKAFREQLEICDDLIHKPLGYNL